MGKNGMPRSNPDLYKAMQELRRSNATVPHEDKRTKRNRTRQTQIKKELDEYGYD